MPIIQVNLLAGRPMETKQRLMKALTETTAATLDVQVETIRVIINEVLPEHWATGGVAKAPVNPEGGS